MAKQNAYLAKQAAVNHGFFEAGLQMGRQQILDMMSIVLNDPKYVKKDVFGKDRLLLGASTCFKKHGSVTMKQITTVINWTHCLPISTVRGCTTHSASGMNIAATMII